MATLPVREDKIRGAIFAAYEHAAHNELRQHLGASVIGDPCERRLWLNFRWSTRPSFEGRVLRLFESGHREEGRLLDNLRAIGCEVHERDPATGKQFWFSDGAHVGGSLDAAALGVPGADKTWHVVECKTHNARSFAALLAKGVEIAQPKHAAQMQCYMGWSGMTRALYLAQCKDTDDLYTERVRFDAAAFHALRDKAQRIVVRGAAPPPPTDVDCQWCDVGPVCRGEALPLVTCRSCVNGDPSTTPSRWECALTGELRNAALQERGCERHLFIPCFVDGTVVGEGDGWIAYESNGVRWANSTPAAFPAIDNAECYRSVDMVRM